MLCLFRVRNSRSPSLHRKLIQSPGHSTSPEDRHQGMSSRSMDASLARRTALPYLTLVERRRFIETLDSPSVHEDRAESSPPHPLLCFAPFATDFVFRTWYCHNRFEIRYSRRNARRPRTSGSATRLRAWLRDIFKRTRLVLLAHHAGPRIVIRTRARAHASFPRFLLDAITARSSTSRR